MKFGHFDDDAREYVITTPRTPLPWINYLGSEAFFSLVSHTAGGYSFYKDAKLRRITRYRYNNVPADSNGRYYYIKEGSTIWNPGWQPTQTELDFYECRHGLGYSIITGKKNNLAARLELFVPVGDNCEIDRLVLTNESGAPKSFTVFSYVEFCLWNAVDDSTNYQRNFSTGEVEVEGSTIYHKTEYRERRDHYALYTVNAPVDGFDTSRDAFLGAWRSNANPEVVEKGACTNSVAHGWAPVGVHQVNITLAPGESRSLIYMLGYIENPQEEKWAAPGVINKTRAHELMARYATDAQVDEARPYGEYLEPVPVHGHLQHEPFRQLLRERHRPRHGFPGQLPGLAGLCAPHPRPRPRAYSGHRRHTVPRRQRLPPVPAADQKGQHGRWLRLQR